MILTAISPGWNKSKHFRRGLILEKLEFHLLEDENKQRQIQAYRPVAWKVHHLQLEKNAKRGRCHFSKN